MKEIIKKFISMVLAFTLAAGCAVSTFGADFSQPYESGTAGSDLFRIPAMITLKNGSLLTSADIRYGFGSDSPANIDTGVSWSADNGKTWSEINVVNHFSDFEDKSSDRVIAASASFIDSALLQSSEGTVFLVCDACPAFIGSAAARLNGNGYIDGKIVLCDKTTETEPESGSLTKEAYPYYIGGFENGFAQVKYFKDSSCYNGYYVDEEYNLYQKKNDSLDKVMIPAFDNKGEKTDALVQANVFYVCSPVKIYPTFYTWMRKSTDNGKTWSKPFILNEQISAKGFTGICPGKGIAYKTGQAERLMFAVYDTNEGHEITSVIYSDDNGETWHRGGKITVNGPAKKTSESQMVLLNDGTIRIFSRNSGDYIGFADSRDGGKTWTNHRMDGSLKYCSDCMVSFVNCSGTIDGKSVVIASFPSSSPRKLGIIKVGIVDAKNHISWEYEYKVTDSEEANSYQYSCLAELGNGTFALLYESDRAEITYRTVSFDELVSENTKVNPFRLILQKILTILMYPLSLI